MAALSGVTPEGFPHGGCFVRKSSNHLREGGAAWQKFDSGTGRPVGQGGQLSSSVGDKFIVPAAGAFALPAAVINFRRVEFGLLAIRERPAAVV